MRLLKIMALIAVCVLGTSLFLNAGQDDRGVRRGNAAGHQLHLDLR